MGSQDSFDSPLYQRRVRGLMKGKFFQDYTIHDIYCTIFLQQLASFPFVFINFTVSAY